MVSRTSIDEQLSKIGYSYALWGRGEAGQLPNMIMESETIVQCVNGHYKAGFAMLCATDQRVLLIDHKPLQYLAVEDLCYDRITQINFDYRLFEATIHFYTNNIQTVDFSSWNKQKLRLLVSYAQQRVTELHWRDEQQYARQQQLQNEPAAVSEYQEIASFQAPTNRLIIMPAVIDDSASAIARYRKNITRFIINSALQGSNA